MSRRNKSCLVCAHYDRGRCHLVPPSRKLLSWTQPKVNHDDWCSYWRDQATEDMVNKLLDSMNSNPILTTMSPVKGEA